MASPSPSAAPGRAVAAAAVRGYTTNAASGDRGYLTSLELHRSLPEVASGLNVYGFFDHGAVYSTFPKRTTASSLGAGLTWSPIPETELQLSIACPLSEILRDQDDYEVYGRVVFRPRLW